MPPVGGHVGVLVHCEADQRMPERHIGMCDSPHDRATAVILIPGIRRPRVRTDAYRCLVASRIDRGDRRVRLTETNSRTASGSVRA